MVKISKKTAALLALFIGLMSVFAGSKVLFGIDTKDYNILNWLVIYNVILGLISIYAAYLIWRDNEKSKNLTLFILTMHFMVFIYLKFFSDTVALESIKAMIFRTGIWIIIALLSIVIPNFFNQQKNNNKI